MFELENFYNAGTGWICKRCESELKEFENTGEQSENLPRVWREGEAESKRPQLAAPLAKWADAARNQLVCPRCNTSETVDKS
jgi:rubredoxin